MSESKRPFYRRRGVIIAAIAVGIPVLAFAWWLGSPLLFDKTVIEDFPRAAAAEIPAGMTAQDVEQEMIEAEADDSTAREGMPPDDPVAKLMGEFVDADSFHSGSGTATIYELADGSRVLRFEELEVTNGPDLHVLLSPVAAPESRDEVTAAGYVDLGGLKGNKGDQNYDIPSEFDLSQAMSVVIYCQPFHVIFSTATLTEA